MSYRDSGCLEETGACLRAASMLDVRIKHNTGHSALSRSSSGALGRPEKGGVDVKIQEDQVGKDVLNITRPLRAEPKSRVGVGGMLMYSWKKRKKEGSLRGSHDVLAGAAFTQPVLSLCATPWLSELLAKGSVAGPGLKGTLWGPFPRSDYPRRCFWWVGGGGMQEGLTGRSVEESLWVFPLPCQP